MLDASAFPLAGWADRKLTKFAALSDAPAAFAGLSGTALLGERAALNGYTLGGLQSAGGGCRLYQTSDGWVALNLAREDDRLCLPAVFGIDSISSSDIAEQIKRQASAGLVAKGRLLGMAIADWQETPASPPALVLAERPALFHKSKPRILDLSALWAGPLASHLLWQAGADVIRIENPDRPDRMREGDSGLFRLINQGKANMALNLKQQDARAAFLQLLESADIVISANRPRALEQLGLDPSALITRSAGLIWLNITAHGGGENGKSDAAGWVGFGDDCAVAGGLTHALYNASGKLAFVGDAIADPLTGIEVAYQAMKAFSQGRSAHIMLSMSSIVRQALKSEMLYDRQALNSSLRRWAAAEGEPFPEVASRAVTAHLANLGADNMRLLQRL